MVEGGALKKITDADSDNSGSASTALNGTPTQSEISIPSNGALSIFEYVRFRRWISLHSRQLRSILFGALSLTLFLIIWHFLTKYRVNIYVRFINVPSPEAVLERALRAAHDPKFFMHVGLSCRRILIGFMCATIVAVPLGLVMGRFRTIRDFIFPVTEVMRPIPAIAWVPMSIMLWPSNEESIVFITFLGSFFPILINTLHGMAMVDPVFVRAAQCLGARESSIFREVYFPASLPHIFTGLTVGMGVAWVSLIAAEMISGQFGIGYFTEACAGAVFRHCARHGLHRHPRSWISPLFADRPSHHALGR